MAEILHDQAEGLRRLMAVDFFRTVAFVGGSAVGKSLLAGHLAHAFSGQGRGVAVWFESPATARDAFGVEWNVVPQPGGQRSMASCLSRPNPQLAIGLLPQAPARVTEAVCREWWDRGWQSVQEKAELVLVEQSAKARRAHAMTLAAQEIVVVITPQAESLTAAYAWMKRLVRDFSHDRFHIVANRSDALHGEQLFDRLRSTAQRFIGTKLEYLGAVPFDPLLPWKRWSTKAPRTAGPLPPGALAIRQLALTIDAWPRPWEEHGYVHGLTERLTAAYRVLAGTAGAAGAS